MSPVERLFAFILIVLVGLVLAGAVATFLMSTFDTITRSMP